MGDQTEIKWLTEPAAMNYPASASYLNLLYDDATVRVIVKKLKKSPITQFKAKDVFRASGLSLLGVSNSHVDKNRNKIKDGEELSPILLVRDDRSRKVIIADGYHRLCAVYLFSEDSFIPCKIV